MRSRKRYPVASSSFIALLIAVSPAFIFFFKSFIQTCQSAGLVSK